MIYKDFEKLITSSEETCLKFVDDNFKYPNLTVKKTIIESVANMCIIDSKNIGIKKVDVINKNLYFVLEFTRLCLVEINDLFIPDEEDKTSLLLNVEIAVEFYDLCMELGIVDHMISKCQEIGIFITMDLDNYIDNELLETNSVSAVLNNKLNELLTKIPEIDLKNFVKDLPKQLNRLKPENVELINKALNYNQELETKKAVLDSIKQEEKDKSN